MRPVNLGDGAEICKRCAPAAGVAVPFQTRHRAPVLQVAWRPSSALAAHPAAEGDKGGGGGGGVLHSLCGAGCLLRWDQLSAAVSLLCLRNNWSPLASCSVGGYSNMNMLARAAPDKPSKPYTLERRMPIAPAVQARGCCSDAGGWDERDACSVTAERLCFQWQRRVLGIRCVSA